MLLKEVLTLSRVEIDPTTISTKKRLLEQVATLCAPVLYVGDFFEALLEREKLGSTSLGHGVALPHARIDYITQPVAAFIRLKQPLQYDGESVDLIFGLFVPKDEHTEHLHLLSQVAECLNDETTRTALRHAHSSSEIWHMLTQSPGKQTIAS